MTSWTHASTRCVVPEALDELGEDDPRALKSRRDLMRIHVVMRSVSALRRSVVALHLAAQPRRILEVGAGDGSLLLRFAGALRPRWSDVELTLLDRLDLVSPRTREAYRKLGWRVTIVRENVLDWCSKPGDAPFDLCLANLFLHHFEEGLLGGVLSKIATSSNAFVACEPRRNAAARIGSRLVVLLGANRITREDAVKSVDAGFSGRELSASWDSAGEDWVLNEFVALPFTHCFLAVRPSARAVRSPHAV